MNDTSSLTTLEFDRVLTLVAMEAKSAPGKAAIARRRPLRTIEECEAAQCEKPPERNNGRGERRNAEDQCERAGCDREVS
jgi:hypothetical protein